MPFHQCRANRLEPEVVVVRLDHDIAVGVDDERDSCRARAVEQLAVEVASVQPEPVHRRSEERSAAAANGSRYSCVSPGGRTARTERTCFQTRAVFRPPGLKAQHWT